LRLEKRRISPQEAVWLLALALFCACAAPGQQQRPERTQETGVDPNLAQIIAQVRVHLPQHDRAATLEVASARGLERVTRQGSLISDGSRRAPLLTFDSPQGVRLFGVLHRGRLLVEPHPVSGLLVTVELPLEDYIEGVVAAELSLWSAEPAELEAQAIAARSYALGTLLQRRRRLGNPSLAKLEGGTQDQAYRGMFEPDSSAGSQAAARRLKAAVAKTRGQVLFLEGQPFAARYSAACGGHTARLVQVFPSPIRAEAALTGAVCEGCVSRIADTAPEDPRGSLEWQTTFSPTELHELARSLGLGSNLLRYELGQRDPSGRWLSVILVGERTTREIPAETLRAQLGHSRLRSTRIVSTWPHAGQAISAGLYFKGLGHGHGVGLCQQGARDAARRGWSAQRILAGAYPGTEIRRLQSANRRRT
jgi:stage II sporulation protein D